MSVYHSQKSLLDRIERLEDLVNRLQQQGDGFDKRLNTLAENVVAGFKRVEPVSYPPKASQAFPFGQRQKIDELHRDIQRRVRDAIDDAAKNAQKHSFMRNFLKPSPK